MGKVREWNRDTRFTNIGRTLKITPDEVTTLIETYGATAALSRGTADTRVTVTRLATLGIFAFGARKRTGDLQIRLYGLNGQVLRAISISAKREDAAKFWADEFNRRRYEYWSARGNQTWLAPPQPPMNWGP